MNQFLIRQIVVGLGLTTALAFYYANGFDPNKDSATIATVLGLLGGVDGIMAWVNAAKAKADQQPFSFSVYDGK